MKTTLLYLSSFLLTATVANTQPVLTTATNAIAAGEIFFSQPAKVGGITIGTTGASQVWDYAGLIDSANVEVHQFLAAAGTPYISLFPDANLVDTISVMGGGYTYSYLKSGNIFELFGSASEMDTTIFSPSLVFIEFPFTYLDSYADSSDVYNYGQGFRDTARYKQRVLADGYGTLHLPGGVTFNNVLRVTEVDSIGKYYPVLGWLGAKITQIAYFTPGYHERLLSIVIGPSGGITSVDYAKDVTLPVNLVSFSGTLAGSNTQLQWQTSNELNMAVFNVQRSTDAVHFSDVFAIKAKGNGGSYTYSDNVASLSGKVYYRLQQVDKNGKITYSNTLAVTIKGKPGSFTILPNPVRNYFTIIPDAAVNINNATIAVRDMAGNTVLRQKLSNNGEQKINVSSLPKGVYMVSINATGSVQSQKIVVE